MRLIRFFLLGGVLLWIGWFGSGCTGGTDDVPAYLPSIPDRDSGNLVMGGTVVPAPGVLPPMEPLETPPVPGTMERSEADETGSPTPSMGSTVGPSPVASAETPSPHVPHPTPIPPIADWEPSTDSDELELPVYSDDDMRLLAAAVQCQFPDAVYLPELHRAALRDVAIRWRQGITVPEYTDALLYYLDNGLSIGIATVTSDILRMDDQTGWSCTSMLQQQQIVIAVDTFEVVPTIFSVVPVQEDQGTILLFVAYE